MLRRRSFRGFALLGIWLVLAAGPALAAGNPMTLVGASNPWSNGLFSNAAVDADRNVAFLGSFDDQGVAVFDTSSPSKPVLAAILSTHITSPSETSDSADLDRQGHYLAVSHQPQTAGGFSGISIYDIGPDPHHPALVRRVAIPGGVHTVQLDPEVDGSRPYAYANAFEYGVYGVYIVNILTGAILSIYQSPEPQGCYPSDNDCQAFNTPHEGWIQRHPDTGRVLDYVAYWDSGMRIVDVTDPANPVEVGSYDYPGANGDCCAHSTAPTPSGDIVYLEDELGFGGTGGVHVLDTQGCDGVHACHPVEIGFWHINGHPVQAAAINGRGAGAGHGVIQRAWTWDAHNIDVRGEDTLLVANYTMGIRLINTSDKANPVETSFYLPNANKKLACRQNCGFQGRETWGAYFGSDGLIYASDFWLGFFIVNPG